MRLSDPQRAALLALRDCERRDNAARYRDRYSIMIVTDVLADPRTLRSLEALGLAESKTVEDYVLYRLTGAGILAARRLATEPSNGG